MSHTFVVWAPKTRELDGCRHCGIRQQTVNNADRVGSFCRIRMIESAFKQLDPIRWFGYCAIIFYLRLCRFTPCFPCIGTLFVETCIYGEKVADQWDSVSCLTPNGNGEAQGDQGNTDTPPHSTAGVGCTFIRTLSLHKDVFATYWLEFPHSLLFIHFIPNQQMLLGDCLN